MARRHACVERCLRGRCRPRRSTLREQRHQRVEKLRLPQRLREIGGEQRFAVPALAPAERAEEHQRQVRAGSADSTCDLDAVHLGHVHVDDCEIEGLVLLQPAQRLLG